MNSILILIFIVLCIFCLFEIKNKQESFIVFAITWFLLFLIAGFRVENIDRDYGSYVKAFNEDDVLSNIYEPTFIFFTYLIKSFLKGNVALLFVFYAFFGVLIKSYSIFKIANFPLFSCIIYLAYFFTLQDMTQIRVGAALSFFLLGIPFLYSRNWKLYFTCISISFCFHFSTFFLAFLFLIDPRKLNKYYWTLFLFLSVGLSFLLKPLLANIFETFDFWIFQNKVLAYGDNMNAELNVFNFWIILRFALTLFLLSNIDKIAVYSKYAYVLMKIYVLSISFFYLFSFNPVFANRTNDILGIVEICLFPCIIYLLKPKWLGKFILIFYATCFMFLNLFYLKIFN